MQLHNNSGNITVIIDVSFDDRDMFTDFILNEQCQFIDSVVPEGLIKFEWFLDEDSIEHYARCPCTRKLRQSLHLPPEFDSLVGFMNGLANMSDEEFVLNSLVVYAVYSTVNQLRHSNSLGEDQVQHGQVLWLHLRRQRGG